MGKSTHFLGQPLYDQVIKLLDKAEILEISRKNGGERYIKRFDVWTEEPTTSKEEQAIELLKGMPPEQIMAVISAINK